MLQWTHGPKPVCEGSESNYKCRRCEETAKCCVWPAGTLKSFGIELARVLALEADHNDSVKSAQASIKNLVRDKKRAAAARKEYLATSVMQLVTVTQESITDIERLATNPKYKDSVAKMARKVEENIAGLQGLTSHIGGFAAAKLRVTLARIESRLAAINAKIT
ncbi:hypothetical protein ANO14919_055030 [Xylariales sp. No.14919]|nr:hypothetical protein ANO14919_055030 [Xylariales sp. No.14919]